ncbi:MAG: alpha/beta fold hydrolase [Candidatus Uhrbacteria bacterium]|nr:alpha/beta hydrolase [Patescibacteria group bacterium]MBU1906709.1 alpha/beta hydrolase [Patescibacteria group bacterium]
MKKVFIVHGWEGSPEDCWIPWLKRELETKGYTVKALAMPDPDAPKIETWVPHLRDSVGTPDEDTILVGHSMGGATIIRYLESLPEGARVGKAVLVAPAIDIINQLETEEEIEIAKPWLDIPIDERKVKSAAKQIVGFFSDNDPYIPTSSAQYAKDHYGARTMIEHDMGHFDLENNITKVPSVLDEILQP